MTTLYPIPSKQRLFVEDVVARYKRANPEGHFFDDDTMRFFDSRVTDAYQLTDGRQAIVMSDRDTHHWGVNNGKRYYYYVIIECDGRLTRPYKDVTRWQGVWGSLDGARRALAPMVAAS